MDARDLQVFEAVARLGGMNRAAAELNTVQSNVTARVRALEEELGVELFRRHSRGVALTHAGVRLMPYAAKIRVLLAEARLAASDAGVPQGPLAIGSLETTAAQRLSPIIASFGTAYPKVNLTLKVGTNAAMIEKVLAHEIDGAFVCGPISHQELAAEVMFREELVLATAPNVKAIGSVLNCPCRILVKGPGCAYRERLESMLAARNISNFDYLEFGTLDAIIGCIAAGLGVTLLPRIVLQAAENQGQIRLHELATSERVVETLFIRRNDVFDFNALRAFIETCRSHNASFLTNGHAAAVKPPHRKAVTTKSGAARF